MTVIKHYCMLIVLIAKWRQKNQTPTTSLNMLALMGQTDDDGIEIQLSLRNLTSAKSSTLMQMKR